MTQVAQDLVRGFRGENRKLPDDMLPDTVSPDAQNVDYSRGTIRKRDGFTRLHSESIKEGGVRVSNSATTACIFIEDHSALDLAGDFSIECTFRLDTTSSFDIIGKYESGVGGWRFYAHAAQKIQFSFYDGSLVFQTMNTAVLERGRTYHIMARRTGTAATLYLDGVSVSSKTISGESTTTRDVYIGANTGAAPVSSIADFLISEFRIWSDLRTDAEIAQYKDQQLDSREILNANLVGYWPMTDARWGVVEDKSTNLRHGYFFDMGPSFVPGLLPGNLNDGTAIRFDKGVENTALALYNSVYAPILNTGDSWTIEGWFRLDKDMSASGTFVALGDDAVDNGQPFRLYYDSSKNLYYTYSTTTTHSNVAVDTTYDIVVGVPFHVALVRDDDTVTCYINGEQVQQTTSVSSENGPTTSNTVGMLFGFSVSTTNNAWGNVTLDDVRLWTSARSQTEIQQWMNQEYVDVSDANLVGYWRFDAPDKKKDETENNDISLVADGNKPEWSYGLVYPAEPPRLQLVAPFSQPQSGDEVRSGADPFSREVVVATRTDFFRIVGNELRHLKRFDTPGIRARFDWCVFQNKLIMCNGLEANQKYTDADIPQSVTIATPAAKPTEALAGAGSGWTGSEGAHSYRYSYRNEKDGTESLASAVSDNATVISSTDTVDLSVLTASTNPQVTHVRIYRKDVGATTYRFLADVANGTTTYSDTGTDISNNDVIDDLRGHPDPQNWCASYDNRLWFASQNALYFSEAGTINFPAINTRTVDPSDGDIITGIAAAFGGLVVFKRRSIYFLSGHGATSFSVSKEVSGTGCVAGQTIAESPAGLYFLGYDGVYLFTGAGVQYLSISQQDLFLTQDPELYREAAGVYDPKTHQYIVSFDTATRGLPAYYDEQPSLYTNYYKLADNTDETGAADLTETDAPDYIADSQRNKVALFNGTTDEMEATTSYPTTTCVLGAWIKPSSNRTFGNRAVKLHSGTDEIAILWVGSYIDSFVFSVKNSLDSENFLFGPPGSVIPGEWTHVVGVRESGRIKLYLNGKAVNTGAHGNGFSGGAAPVLSIGKQEGTDNLDAAVSNVFYINDGVLSAREVMALYEYESTLGFLKKNRISMVFDEESTSWAKWDVGFDCLALGAHSGNRAEVLGGKNGYVHKLFYGHTDGGSVLSGSTINVSGTVTANATAEIEDTSAAFPTDGDGLAGTTLLVQSSVDTTTQTRLIIGNTATKLYLDNPLSPSITGTYYIAPIDFYWESRWMDMGDPSVMKRLFSWNIWVRETSETVTMKWKSNDYETWQSDTFSTSDEFIRALASTRGRKIKVRFEHVTPNAEVEIESFQGIFAPKRFV